MKKISLKRLAKAIAFAAGAVLLLVSFVNQKPKPCRVVAIILDVSV